MGSSCAPVWCLRVRRGSKVEPQAPQEVRRVISAQTANTLTDMMIQVVDHNTLSTTPKVPGYTIAGKTGTADMPTTEGYISGKTYASYRSASRPPTIPAYHALVRIDSPKKEIYGGEVASPLFRKLAEQLFIYYRIPPMSPSRAEAGDGADPAARDRGDPAAVPISSYPGAFAGVSADSRRVRPGDLFVALKGERVTGTTTWSRRWRTVRAAPWWSACPIPPSGGRTATATPLRSLLVENTLLALQRLARYWRRTHAVRQSA